MSPTIENDISPIRYWLASQNTKSAEKLSHMLEGAMMEISKGGNYGITVKVDVLVQHLDDVRKKTYTDLLTKAISHVKAITIRKMQIRGVATPELEAQTTIVASQHILGEAHTAEKFKCDVFMIMPFAAEFRAVYEDHVKPVVEMQNLKIKRGDDMFSRGTILQDIWSSINNCRLVIADCTGRNPNVFYELGLAHALNKPAIITAQSLDDIPFDLRQFRCIVYTKDFDSVGKFRKELSDALLGFVS